MKKMNIKFLAGTAFAVSAAAALAGCGMPEPTVYGPAPTELVETTEETTKETTTQASDTFDPETEVQEDVYGPPEWFEGPENEVQEDVYGPPEWFEGPENEVQEDVYGPPEWFD